MNAAPLPIRTLGRTGIGVSTIAFGAGPVSGLMTGDDIQAQDAVLRRALDRGINWIDTAAGYGNGASEANLGRVLQSMPSPAGIHLATKVRMSLNCADWLAEARRSLEKSLDRLQCSRVTLLQLHNGITLGRGDEPASLTPDDVLAPRGILNALQRMRDADLVQYLGLTGTGHPAALRKVIDSGGFDTLQVPYHLLNPSAGQHLPAGCNTTDYGQILRDCQQQQMGVFAIRVFAAGALLGQPPSPHTRVTPYFPLALYDREAGCAARLAQQLPAHGSLKELAVRYVLSQAAISSAIIGFASPEQVDEVADIAALGPLDGATRAAVDDALYRVYDLA